jgi:hypothetical protein
MEDIYGFSYSGIQDYHNLTSPAKPLNPITFLDHMDVSSSDHQMMQCNQRTDRGHVAVSLAIRRKMRVPVAGAQRGLIL